MLSKSSSPLLALLICAGCGFGSVGDDLVDTSKTGNGFGKDASSGGIGGTGAGGTAGSVGGAAGQGGVSGSGGSVDASPEGAAGDAGQAGSSGGPADAATDAPLAEDCTNGIDDNGDSLVDCADPICGPGYVCVPRPPNGWSEPGYILMVAGGTAGDCESLVPFGKLLHEGLTAPPASCPCTCESPSGGTCNGSGILWQYGACAGDSATSDESCSVVPSMWTIGSVLAHFGAVVTPGTCESSVGTVLVPAEWESDVTLCLPAAQGGGCGANAACISRPPQGSTGQVCIASSGDKGCSGAFPLKELYFEGYDDTRGCNAGSCWCASAQGQTCSGEYQLFSDDACSNEVFSAPLDGNCHNTGLTAGQVRSDRIVTYAPEGGSCQPQGTGAAIGGAVENSPYTVCCTSQPVQ